MRSRVGIVLSLSLLWASLRASALTLVNITVDDNDPSVIYAPSDDWSFGPSCSTCTARVDASQAFNGTWHDTLFSPSDPSEDETQTAELSFIGSAIYVYGILSNAMNNPSGNADQVFFVDGVRAGNFTHTPSGDGSFEYSVLLFSAQLPNGSHNLTLQNGQPTDVSSLILLDYFVYTTAGIVTAPSSSSNSISTSASTSVASTGQVVSSTPSSPPAASSSASGNASGSSASRRRTIIIVVVVICIAVVALLALFVLLRHRRFSRRNMTDPSAFPPEAFSINPFPPTTMAETAKPGELIVRSATAVSAPRKGALQYHSILTEVSAPESSVVPPTDESESSVAPLLAMPTAVPAPSSLSHTGIAYPPVPGLAPPGTMPSAHAGGAFSPVMFSPFSSDAAQHGWSLAFVRTGAPMGDASEGGLPPYEVGTPGGVAV